jgi:hypothetical protein
MAYASIIVARDDIEQVLLTDLWFTRWAPRLSYISQNEGCGCCVDIWKIEGPQDAFDDLPKETYVREEWIVKEYIKTNVVRKTPTLYRIADAVSNTVFYTAIVAIIGVLIFLVYNAL